MKKTLITILLAFGIGVSLTAFTIYSLKDKFLLLENKNTVTAFQVGVYKSKENADRALLEHPGAISVKDGEYYRVFVGVAKDKTYEKLLETFFLDRTVYPKEIEVTKNFFQEINLWESQINQNDTMILERMNQEIMKKLEGEIL